MKLIYFVLRWEKELQNSISLFVGMVQISDLQDVHPISVSKKKSFRNVINDWENPEITVTNSVPQRTVNKN